ncbi:MAG: hypothetical protein WCP06_11360 [Verrucomicrobiota bacterium]
MKGFLTLLLIFGLLATIGSYRHRVEALIKEREELTVGRDALRKERDKLNEKPALISSHGSESPHGQFKPQGTRVVCPACNGEKSVPYDINGQGNPLDVRTEPCPVCIGNGFRNINIPPGNKLCPSCSGMGVVFTPIKPKQHMQARSCSRCSFRGYVPDIH